MEGASSELVWTAPAYDVSKRPRLEHQSALLPGKTANNFARWARWSPDGSVALAQCEDASFQYLDLPETIAGTGMSAVKARVLPQPAPILDFAWYPFATSRDPAGFCFVASVRETPVKLLDAADGRLRASYKIVDHRERQIAPHSLAFNVTGTKLYCGFEDAIEVFDLHVPGEGTRLRTTPSKKSRDGLKGIISSLAFAPDATSGVFAAGTLSPSAPASSNIALFAESTGEVPAMFVGDERAGQYGIRASVNQLKFNPCRPYLLYASFRRQDAVYCWDIRGDVTKPLQKFSPEADGVQRMKRGKTNQRLRFDIDIGGNWLGVGDHHGGISMYDLNTVDGVPLEGQTVTTVTAPTLTFEAHDDAVGSVAFHPLQSMLLSVSGSRHYPEGSSTESSSSESDEDGHDDQQEVDTAPSVKLAVRRPKERPSPLVKDASIKSWDFGGESSGPRDATVPAVEGDQANADAR